MNNTIEFLIDEKNSGLRVDIYLSNKIDNLTRSYIKKIIKENNVKINDVTINNSSKKIKTKDKIVVNFKKDYVTNLVSNNIKLDIIFEDKDILVVNKPKGMIVHPGAGNNENTLVNALLFKYKKNLSDISGALRPGIVHRIDKETSGLLVVAKNNLAHSNKELDRRVNVLIYLNKDWKREYNGYLELWDKEMQFCKKKISPDFNKMVIFSTTDFSNHGHPEPLKCPKNKSRKSLALYYFSNGRPQEEILDKNLKNRTLFKSRAGHSNEVKNNKDYFKVFLRKFSWYQKMKKFEKKYLRKKK